MILYDARLYARADDILRITRAVLPQLQNFPVHPLEGNPCGYERLLYQRACSCWQSCEATPPRLLRPRATPVNAATNRVTPCGKSMAALKLTAKPPNAAGRSLRQDDGVVSQRQGQVRPLRHTTPDWIGQVFARAPFHTHPVTMSCLAVKHESPLGSCVSPIINCDGMN